MAFEFDRYINGELMAEGVTIERQDNLPDAMRAAARIASRGPNGEAPVLVLRDNTLSRTGAGKVRDKPTIHAVFECSENGITGTTKAAVKRVMVEDDGSFTVVIDHWPAPEGRQEAVAYGEDIGGKIVSVRLDKSRHCTVPLYTRPSEQAVTEAEHE